jgi:hypothetical protein
MAQDIKPTVFIGSSSENRKVVETLLPSLNMRTEATPWWASPAFAQDDTTFGALLTAVMSYDSAIFVIAADDLTTSRGSTKFTVRDNVLFELGLFMGQLGRERVIAILEQLDSADRIKMPSDLLGLLMPGFTKESAGKLRSSIEQIVPTICERIRRAGLRHFAFSLRRSWDFDSVEHEFLIVLDPVRIDRNRILIGERLLALVIRKRDKRKILEEDTTIVIGEIRKLSRLESELNPEVTLAAGTKGCLGSLLAKDIVEGYLILGPEGVDEDRLRQCKCLGELFMLGCRIIDSVGIDLA